MIPNSTRLNPRLNLEVLNRALDYLQYCINTGNILALIFFWVIGTFTSLFYCFIWMHYIVAIMYIRAVFHDSAIVINHHYMYFKYLCRMSNQDFYFLLSNQNIPVLDLQGLFCIINLNCIKRIKPRLHSPFS